MLLIRTILILGCLSGVVQASEEIKVYRVGSSSFPYDIIVQTRAIVEAMGDYKLVCDAKRDHAGYTRLDELVRKPALLESWLETNIPRIREGQYDFVVFQTISWLTLTPKQQNYLVTEMIPRITREIRDTGADVILYDKYLPLELDQKNADARHWCLRYPHGQELNYLLHIVAAKKSGFERITFGGEVKQSLVNQKPFVDLGPAYTGGGHPGPMANYITAINLAALLTGAEPVNDQLRILPCPEWTAKGLSQSKYSDRLGNDGTTVRMTDEEAAILQESALANQRRWQVVLEKSLNDETAFKAVTDRIEEIQSDELAFDKYGIDKETAEKLRFQFTPAKEGELRPHVEQKIRNQSRMLSRADTAIRKALSNEIARDAAKSLELQFVSYWNENNRKFRDDIYTRAVLAAELAELEGDLEKAKRIETASRMLRTILALPGYRMVYDALPAHKKADFLSKCDITGPAGRLCPSFRRYHNEHLDHPDTLFAAWDVFLKIWTDPNLMDALRDHAYPEEPFAEADARFAEMMSTAAKRDRS